jgi:hypothetical protein
MKRIALVLVAIGAVVFGALGHGAVEAYQPVSAEILTDTPDSGFPEFRFTAMVTNCFPGERVYFRIAIPTWTEPADPVPPTGADVIRRRSALCSEDTFTARVRFTAPAAEGVYPVTAFMAAEDDPNPDIPDRPDRLLVEEITVTTTIIVVPTDSDPTVVTTAGSGGDSWSDVVFSMGVLRTFLGLLALLAAIFLVVLWRRRALSDEAYGTSVGGAVAPPDPQRPSMA